MTMTSHGNVQAWRSKASSCFRRNGSPLRTGRMTLTWMDPSAVMRRIRWDGLLRLPHVPLGNLLGLGLEL